MNWNKLSPAAGIWERIGKSQCNMGILFLNLIMKRCCVPLGNFMAKVCRLQNSNNNENYVFQIDDKICKNESQNILGANFKCCNRWSTCGLVSELHAIHVAEPEERKYRLTNFKIWFLYLLTIRKYLCPSGQL